MARQKIITYWACDFETTVWGEKLEQELGKKQDHTEVWAAADVKLYDETETVTINHSIRDFLDRFLTMKRHNILYFHNLSFDGSFIIDFLLREGYKFYMGKDKYMPSRTFQTSISRMGSWYWIKIKLNKTIIEIRNSLKLMPSSLKAIGKSFQTKHQKLDMEYEGLRHAYCEITEEEKEYIRNDVLVLKEALEKMFDEKHNSLTIGSCCMKEFKSFYTEREYNRLFPDLREDELCIQGCEYSNLWDYVHKSYNGGWCFVNPKYAHQVVGEGKVYDVNSLYPSMMHSESGNRYPYGHGQYVWGAPSEELISNNNNKYYFIRIRCRFKLKPGCFPWLHIRGNARYKGNDNLYRSDIRKDGKYYRYYYDFDGNIQDTKHEFILTCTDWELFQETYYLYDLEIVDHVWFWALVGLFDEYIDKYKKIKIENTGFLRTLAKLFLNNLYGKFATSDDSSYKEPVLIDNEVKFAYHEEHEKKVGYIAIGSAITSYARNFTIRHAMANYDRFMYADTDSIHILGEEPAEMVVEHPTNFCCWKNESDFDFAYYERQKMYAEHIIRENHRDVEPYLDIKAAGMSKGAKQEFIDGGYDLHDLTVGLELDSGNLKARRIHGGILLVKQPFKIRKSVDKKVNPMYSSICKQ